MFRSVVPPDINWLISALTSGWTGTARWFPGAAGASAEDIGKRLRRDAEVQAVLVAADERPIAIFQLASLDLTNGHGGVETVITSDASDHAEVLTGLNRFAMHCFQVYPLRRLYMNVLGPSDPSTTGHLDLRHSAFSISGVLGAHQLDERGSPLDLTIWSVNRPTPTTSLGENAQEAAVTGRHL